jgi:hypothetical protein
MVHDLEIGNLVAYFENPWMREINITKIVDSEGNIVYLNDRDLMVIRREIYNHCDLNDWFGNPSKVEVDMTGWMQQNNNFDKQRGII